MRIAQFFLLGISLGLLGFVWVAFQGQTSGARYALLESGSSAVDRGDSLFGSFFPARLSKFIHDGLRNKTRNKERRKKERKKRDGSRKQRKGSERSTDPVSNVVFVKCYKVAGGTLRRILEKQAKIRNLTIVPSPPDKTFSIPKTYGMNLTGTYNMITKHARYHPWMRKLVPDAVFITMIRDPLRRASSHYNHFNPMSKNKTFEKFYMEDYLNLNFSATAEPKIIMGYKDNHIASYLGYAHHRNLTLKSLERRYKFIGLQERFNESMVLLRHVLNWDLKSMEYFYRHYNPNHVVTEPSKEFLEIFKRNNYMDYKIYELGLRHYEEKIKKIPDIDNETRFYVARLDRKAREIRVLKKARQRKPF